MRTRLLIKDGRDRMVFDTLRMISHIKNSSEVARLAGVAPGTILNMRRQPKDGGTMYPRALTLAKIAHAMHAELRFVPQGFKVPNIIGAHE